MWGLTHLIYHIKLQILKLNKSSLGRHYYLALCYMTFCVTIYYACNDHPVDTLEQSVIASGQQNLSLAAKTKIDFLFVVDQSDSMVEEQEGLAQNFQVFSSLIFQELKDSADYRIAVVTTGYNPGNKTFPINLGKFVNRPNRTIPGLSECPDEMSPILTPDSLLEACNISDVACQEQVLQDKFQCLAQVGEGGINQEKGLESMRLALSCNGPNRNAFSECCIDDGRGAFMYNPACKASESIKFLRPDALLVVIFLSDEDDCSTYGDNPIDSPLAVCSIPFEDLGNVNAQQQAFLNPRYCGDRSPNQCFTDECDTSNVISCYETRCQMLDNRGCRQNTERLSSVEIYYNDLLALKPRPADQIIIASIVAPGVYVQGQPIRYATEGLVDSQCENKDFINQNLDYCCPNGNCGSSNAVVACSVGNNEGYAGWRYMRLMEKFGNNGLGCSDGQGVNDCVHICADDLSEPLDALRTKVIEAVGDYCLDKRPACFVNDLNTGKLRPCIPEEENITDHYRSTLLVTEKCNLDSFEGGSCGMKGSSRNFTLNVDYELILDDPTCPTRTRLRLKSPPAAGSTIAIDLFLPRSEL
jgi:hypothetical protein